MEALRNKLKSRRGASILLALLFLLLCMMVGASLVMAAAASAGKIRGNKEEQQKYLTLSSALTLLVDELENAEYVGQYTYQRQELWTLRVERYYNADGTLDWEDWWYEPGTFTNTYTQLENVLGAAGTGQANLPHWDLAVLPLYKNMDQIFRNNFPAAPAANPELGVDPGERVPGETYAYTGVSAASIANPTTLQFKVGGGLNRATYGGLLDPVEIEVTLDPADGHIDLEATLMKDDGTGTPVGTEYKMRARLNVVGNLNELLVLDGGLANKDFQLTCTCSDGDTKRSGDEPGISVHSTPATYTYSGTTTNAPAGNCKTEPVKWKLEYIIKGGGI